jgi:hypothetical protein
VVTPLEDNPERGWHEAEPLPEPRIWRLWRWLGIGDFKRGDVTVLNEPRVRRTLEEMARDDDLLFIPVSRALFERELGKDSPPVSYRFERASNGDKRLVDLIVRRLDDEKKLAGPDR